MMPVTGPVAGETSISIGQRPPYLWTWEYRDERLWRWTEQDLRNRNRGLLFESRARHWESKLPIGNIASYESAAALTTYMFLRYRLCGHIIKCFIWEYIWAVCTAQTHKSSSDVCLNSASARIRSFTCRRASLYLRRPLYLICRLSLSSLLSLTAYRRKPVTDLPLVWWRLNR